MKAIVAVDQNWGIGYRGSLLQRIPGDMKYFRMKTIGKAVVMGRDTFETLPGAEPLADRSNIVLSRDKGFTPNKIIICRSLEELFAELKKHNQDEVFVIGGESVYSQLLSFCTEAYVTKIENSYPADKYFPNLDRDKQWILTEAGEAQSYKDISYRFLRYEKKQIK